jgi:VanZ family protein
MIRDDQVATKADQLASRLFFSLTILFVAFIAAASLTPGSFRASFLKDGVGGWFNQFPPLGEIFSYHDIRDIATNVMLYMPLGVFLSLALSWKRPRFITLWLLVGPAVSFAMEMIQAYIGRFSDPVDLVTNTTGFLLGFWMVVIATRRFSLRPSAFLGIDDVPDLDQKTKSIASLRFLYICVYFIVALLPFDVSVRISQIYSQLFADSGETKRIILDPLHHFKTWWDGGGLKLIFELLGLMPVAILTALMDGLKKRLNVLSPIYICFILVSLTEISQLFILSRTSDIVMFPIALIAGVLGWKAVDTWLKILDTRQYSTEHSAIDRNKVILIALAAYCLIVCLLAWAPYQFEIHPRIVFEKMAYESNLVPFKAHFEVRSIGSAIDIVKEIGIYVPMGLLITLLINNRYKNIRRLKLVILAGLFCGAFGVFTELSQAACVGRYVDVTDIFLAGVGGIIGSALFRLFSGESRQ